jgi:hypothetical protein
MSRPPVRRTRDRRFIRWPNLPSWQPVVTERQGHARTRPCCGKVTRATRHSPSAILWRRSSDCRSRPNVCRESDRSLRVIDGRGLGPPRPRPFAQLKLSAGSFKSSFVALPVRPVACTPAIWIRASPAQVDSWANGEYPSRPSPPPRHSQPARPGPGGQYAGNGSRSFLPPVPGRPRALPVPCRPRPPGRRDRRHGPRRRPTSMALTPRPWARPSCPPSLSRPTLPSCSLVASPCPPANPSPARPTLPSPRPPGRLSSCTASGRSPSPVATPRVSGRDLDPQDRPIAGARLYVGFSAQHSAPEVRFQSMAYPLRMLTVIETCRQQSRDAFAYVTASVQAHSAGQPTPSLLPLPWTGR